MPNIDIVQSNILGVIANMMISYNLSPDQVNERFDYVASIAPPFQTYKEYLADLDCDEEETTPLLQPESISASTSWADICDEDDYESFEKLSSDSDEPVSASSEEDESLWISTRREFTDCMRKGILICPRYSNCTSPLCKNFHMKAEYICHHETKGSYCEYNQCDLIVIRACRKGRKCNNKECSFRH